MARRSRQRRDSPCVSASRRALLAGAAGLAGIGLLPRRAASQAPGVTAQAVSPDIEVLRGPDANAVALATAEGIVLLDGGHRRWSDALLTTVAGRWPDAPVRALINSHWHREQTGANLVLGPAGVDIIAQENTALWLGTRIEQRWSGETFAPLPAAAQPGIRFYDELEFTAGTTRFQLHHLLHAHTDGDLCVHVPEHNLLYTGGVLNHGSWPVIDWWTGGWMVGLLNGLDRLVALADDTTIIIPAVGAPLDKAGLLAERQMYEALFAELESLLRKAWSADEVVAARPARAWEASRGDAGNFLRLAYASMLRHLRDAHDRRMQNIP